MHASSRKDRKTITVYLNLGVRRRAAAFSSTILPGGRHRHSERIALPPTSENGSPEGSPTSPEKKGQGET